MRAHVKHHWSADTILAFDVIGYTLMGAFIGACIGYVSGNVGVGGSLGAFGGMVVGIILGLRAYDRFEQ